MLASNGWQKASKKALKGGHAEHIHANCDCTYAIRFDGKSNVAGYDPDALYEKYFESGFSRGERLRNMQKEYRDGKKNGIININIDGLVPCLRDTKSGEIVDTVVSQVTNKNELKSFSKKNGWYVNWKDVPKDVEVYKLQVKGDEDVQGLIGVRPDRDHRAVYLHWVVVAPQNNPLIGDGTKKYEGVGGHLFAIGAEVSMNNGFGGAMYGYAANKDLVDLYVNHYGAIHLPIEHEYEVFFDEAAAMNILKEYNYEHK